MKDRKEKDGVFGKGLKAENDRLITVTTHNNGKGRKYYS